MPSSLHARVGEVTDRIVKRSHDARRRYLDRIDKAVPFRSDPQEARLRQFRARLCGLRRRRQGRAASRRWPQSRDRHRLQRHAVGASAVRAFPRNHQARGARGRRHGAGRGRRARNVRWRHAGRGGHGAFAVLARRDRAFDRGRALAPDVRRRRLSRRLRQDRAGPADRGAVVRPSAVGVPAGRPDDLGPFQRRQVKDPPALRRGQGDAGRTAGGGVEGLSRPRHLHVLRHRQHQSDADGDHGPASAGRLVRQPEHAAARRADGSRREAGARAHRRRQCVYADRPRDRRARHRQRRRRPACDGRVDQPHDPSDRDGGGGRHRADLGRFRRSRRSDAAAGARLSQRQGRREPFPGGGRHAGHDPLAAAGRLAARRRAQRLGRLVRANMSSSPRSTPMAH